MMTHEVSYDVGMNNFKVQKQELSEFSRMQKRMNDFVISRTTITEEDLEQWAGSEKYFDWDEAFEYGIVTDDLDLDFMYRVDWLGLGEEEQENEE
jgi:ATP-dependent protease ClpP protease subunit